MRPAGTRGPDDAGGGDCPGCGRHYSAAVLEDEGGATLRLPVDVPRRPAPGGPPPDAAADPDETVPLPDAAGPAAGRTARLARPGSPRFEPPDDGGFVGLLPDPAPPAPPGPRAAEPAKANDPGATVPLTGTAGGGPKREPCGGFEPGELSPGTELEHFRIEAPLGRGGMGAVYRALDLSLQRYVAVKVIRPDTAGRSPRATPVAGGSTATGSGSVALDRLLQEARAQARVNHANVAHIYFVSPDPSTPFLAMELVEGPTLADLLKAGPLPYGAVTRVGGQIASALACAAKYDIVHGDVKPSNVLLAGARGDGPNRVGTVKLSDFGLARRTNHRATGVLEGTPNYLAPEVVKGNPPTANSDLYALGVTLFEMTFGRLPYTTAGRGLSHRLNAHVENAPEFPDPWPADLPPGWRAILARLLEKDPAARPADAAEAARAIRRLAPQSGTTAGLLVRTLAWAADVLPTAFLSAALLAAVLIPGRGLVEEWAPLAAMLASVPLNLLATAAALLPPAAVVWWQVRSGASAGKQLFQLRPVDRHGLRPSRRALALRGLALTFPVWGVLIDGLVGEATGQEWLENALLLFVLVVWLIDHATALFSRDPPDLARPAAGHPRGAGRGPAVRPTVSRAGWRGAGTKNPVSPTRQRGEAASDLRAQVEPLAGASGSRTPSTFGTGPCVRPGTNCGENGSGVAPTCRRPGGHGSVPRKRHDGAKTCHPPDGRGYHSRKEGSRYITPGSINVHAPARWRQTSGRRETHLTQP